METKEPLNLLQDFTPPTWEEWVKEVEAGLKGAVFTKATQTKTYEGITLKPIYRRQDIADLEFVHTQPGESPYQRGNDAKMFVQEGWKIAQAQRNSKLDELNAQLLSELNRGLNVVNLCLAHDDDPRSIRLESVTDLKTALKDIDLEAVELFAQQDVTDTPLLPLLDEYLHKQNKSLSNVSGVIGYDPTGEFARKGYLSRDLEQVWKSVLDYVIYCVEHAPKLRCLYIDGTVYEAGGASSTQELAFVLSTAIGYIQGLIMTGIDIDTIAPRFQVKLSLGSNFFMEIAKIRAFRLLWNEMIKAFGGNEQSRKIWIHGKTASFNKSSYDQYVNMLRTTTEGFSGVIGGVDSLEIDNFDALMADDNEFSRRISRNQQLVLAEEAHFTKVADPAGGCYYIESLTAELANQAWKLMQELEASGGMVRCLRSGKIHELLSPVAKARIDAVHTRKDVFVGVNMYANPADQVLSEDQMETTQDNKVVILEHGRIPRMRAVEPLEALRAKIQPLSKKIFLVTMGSIADYKARADFSSGFFQVGGFEVISGTGYQDVASAVAAAQASGADAYCICSTDDMYVDLVAPLCKELWGKPIILAGYPKDMVETYQAQGVDVFIHLRANLHDTLNQISELMEVQK